MLRANAWLSLISPLCHGNQQCFREWEFPKLCQLRFPKGLSWTWPRDDYVTHSPKQPATSICTTKKQIFVLFKSLRVEVLLHGNLTYTSIFFLSISLWDHTLLISLWPLPLVQLLPHSPPPRYCARQSPRWPQWPLPPGTQALVESPPFESGQNKWLFSSE